MGELKLVRINRVQLSGRVTRDLVLRYAPDGTPVASFTVAFNRWLRSEEGKWREIPGFIGALASGRMAERCAETLRKGSPVYVEGRLQSRSYTSRDGRKHNLVEIRIEKAQFLEKDLHPEDEHHESEPHGAFGARRAEATEGELFPVAEIEEEEDPGGQST